jgi:hypothetical protein
VPAIVLFAADVDLGGDRAVSADGDEAGRAGVTTLRSAQRHALAADLRVDAHAVSNQARAAGEGGDRLTELVDEAERAEERRRGERDERDPCRRAMSGVAVSALASRQ